MNLRRLPLFALALIIGGCSSSPTSSSSPTTTSPPSTAPGTNKPATPDGTTTPPVVTKTPPPSAEKPKLGAVTANLKHDGYEFYGLGNAKPLKLSLTQGTIKKTGAQETSLEELKPDVAVFLQSWTGDLASNGTSKVRVTPDGVYGIEAQGQELKPAQLEMPAKLTPGFKWTSNTPMTVNGETVKSTDSKIVGMKTITIGGKPHEVLLILRSCKVVSGKQTKTLESTEYYERGIGPVKMDVKLSGGGDPPLSFTMEHTE